MTFTTSLAQLTSIFILCSATFFFTLAWALLYDSSKHSVLRDEEQKKRLRKMGLKSSIATVCFYALYFTTYSHLMSIN